MTKIKKALAEDAQVVAKLFGNLFAELGHQNPIAGDNHFISFCKTNVGNEDYVVFLAFDDSYNEACGIIALNEALSAYTGGIFGVIRELYVIPSLRSAGIGQALLNRAKKYAKIRGWKRLEVTAPRKDEWIRIYNFYINSGFSEIGHRFKFEKL